MVARVNDRHGILSGAGLDYSRRPCRAREYLMAALYYIVIIITWAAPPPELGLVACLSIAWGARVASCCQAHAANTSPPSTNVARRPAAKKKKRSHHPPSPAAPPRLC